jgi:hypothetical protein
VISRGLSVTVGDLSESVVTLPVAARAEACARDTVALSIVLGVSADGNVAIAQCSAVPLPHGLHAAGSAAAASSRFFLTAAHCYRHDVQKGVARNQTVLRIGNGKEKHECTLAALFDEGQGDAVLDLALLYCASPVPVPPTALSLRPYAAQAPVVMLGFTGGSHVNDTVLSDELKPFARHVLHTRLASSLQLPPPPAGGAPRTAQASRGVTCSVAAAGGVPLAEAGAPAGFVERSPVLGMSGGGVTDYDCGLLGITESMSRFGQGGSFVRLDAPGVADRVKSAVAAAVLSA